MRIHNDGFFNRGGVLCMLATIMTIVSYSLLFLSVILVISVTVKILMEIHQDNKTSIKGVLFVEKSGELYANLHTNPAELPEGSIVCLKVLKLNTK